MFTLLFTDKFNNTVSICIVDSDGAIMRHSVESDAEASRVYLVRDEFEELFWDGEKDTKEKAIEVALDHLYPAPWTVNANNYVW